MSKNKNALTLLNSMRGNFILSQALFIAIKELKKVPEPYTEHSNIADMELLLDNIFPIYKVVDLTNKQAAKYLAKIKKGTKNAH